MSQFRIDTYSALGVKLNPHTQAVSGVRITDRINQIGECEFTLPAIVAKQLAVARGLKYKLYHEDLGLLGTYTHYDDTVDADAKNVTVKCYDNLVELANRVFAFGEPFTNETVEDIATAIGSAAGNPRTVTFEPGFDSSQAVTLEYQGESFLRALDVLRQYMRGYFRRESDTEIRFGGFGATTPVVRLMAPVMAFADAGGDYATVTSLKRERRGSGVVNTVIPFGAGVGETVVDLSYSTRNTPYSIQSGVFSGSTGELTYYIQDLTSANTYGYVDRVLSFTEVRPITNSAADLENAANAVYDLSAAYLQKYKDPIDVYSLSCLNLPLTAKVGDLVRLDFHGVATLEDETVAWLTLDNQTFFITEITRDFGESGNPISQLTISTNGEEIVGTTEVFTSLIGDVGSLKLRTQPTQTYYTKSSPTMPIDPARNVEMAFYIGSEILAINEMKVEFTLMPLRSPISIAAAGGGVTTTSSSGGGTTTSSASGGGSTQTSTSGGGATVTSASGGGTTQTSTAPNLGHNHVLTVSNGTAAYAVSVDASGNLFAPSGGTKLPPTSLESAHTHSVTIPSHTHDVTISAHTHSVTIPDHTHSVTIPDHTHTITIPTHTHSLTFGVVDDTQSPVGVTVQINGSPVGDIINTATGVNVGASASGDGLYIVDILPTLLAQGDFRNKTHTVLFQAVGNQGQLFAQLLSRVTIQPIAAS